jgi:PAS domain S-box-containing protein
MPAIVDQWRVLFEHAPDACYLTDLKGNFLDGNAAAEALIWVAEQLNQLLLDCLPEHFPELVLRHSSHTAHTA